jgi:hypothetical protein
MTQVFSPAADAWLRLFMVAALSLVAGGIVFAIGIARSDWMTNAGLHPAAQPVPFSHKHHVGGLGLDCRYCHDAVAQSARAGMPATHTCMTCHSQVWTGAPMLAPVRESWAHDKSLRWHRVALLPDYVYFRHDVHIAKGVGCVECHGRVDRMPLTYRAKPLTMQFCLDCHRDPAPRLRPKDQVTSMTWEPSGDREELGRKFVKLYGVRSARKLTDCVTCHR